MFPMPDGTATFDGVFHQMELECKNKRGDGDDAGGWSRRCQQEYGSALYMTPEEKQISFYNRYFIFRKNRNINAKQLKSSFLSYAGLQEEQDRAFAGAADEGEGSIALEKIAKASRPIDVATKPAIAAHILAEREAEKQMEALTSSSSSQPAAAAKTTLKIKPKPKAKNAATTTVKATDQESAAAPIEQIEKKIQKRTKKAKAAEEPAGAGAGEGVAAAAAAGEGAAAKPKRQTKKKTDL
jgi:hypothetical protein